MKWVWKGQVQSGLWADELCKLGYEMGRCRASVQSGITGYIHFEGSSTTFFMIFDEPWKPDHLAVSEIS